jgi:transcriptional regulator with PAS, ATPase and Fis domain
VSDGEGLALFVFETSAAPARFVLPPEGRVSLGRGRVADVQVDDPCVSRLHAMVHVRTDADETFVEVEDLGSANGLRVRGQPLAPGGVARLVVGDSFELGVALVLLTRARPDARPGTQAPPTAVVPEVQDVVALDPRMLELRRVLARVAQSDLSVLLLGETGVGKEVLAEYVHRTSRRAHAAFLRLNCGAFSENLLESELFGHERGAFTGAVTAKPGLLETATGGTVLFDEVGELPLSLQVKLLRVMEEGRIVRVGGLRSMPIDVRYVAATNRDLAAAVDRGSFRRDLYYRLNGISAQVPPLRERPSELIPMAARFLASFAAALERAPPALGDDARRALQAHAWPGNIRELRNVMQRAMMLCEGEVSASHLMLDEPDAAAERALRTLPNADERARVLAALEACGGNQTRAAKALGISRGTLIARLERYEAPRPKKR